MSVILIISLVVLIALSAIFSGSEIALFSLSEIKTNKLTKRKTRGSSSLKKLKSNPHRLLVTILICNNVVNILAASIAAIVLTQAFGESGVGLAAGIMTFLILVFGEITPKSYFHRNNEKMSLVMSPLIYFLSKVLFPVIFIIEAISNGLLWLLKSKKPKDNITEEEILTAISMGSKAGIIDKDEGEMMKNIIELGDTLVKDVMTPKNRMVFLRSDSTILDAMTVMIKTGYSRIPVMAHGTKKVIGMVYPHSMLSVIKKKQFDTPLIKIITPISKVSEDARLDNVFDKLKENTTHMAVVIDKKKKVSGIITMENILEEIVGEIHDESDAKRHSVYFMDKRTAIVKGDVSIKELKEKIDIVFKTNKNTLSYMVSSKLSNSPKVGDKIELNNYSIIVMTVDNNKQDKITSVKLIKKKGKIRKR